MSGLIKKPNSASQEDRIQILAHDCAIGFGLVELNCRKEDREEGNVAKRQVAHHFENDIVTSIDQIRFVS